MILNWGVSDGIEIQEDVCTNASIIFINSTAIRSALQEPSIFLDHGLLANPVKIPVNTALTIQFAISAQQITITLIVLFSAAPNVGLIAWPAPLMLPAANVKIIMYFLGTIVFYPQSQKSTVL